MNVHDEECSGHPTVITDELTENVNAKICENRMLTISQLSIEFHFVLRSGIYDILTEKLGYRKLCSRWVPKILTETRKEKCLAAAQTFLRCYKNEGDDLWKHIVTSDEMWISYLNVKTQQQSM
ncbi:uncharacterized protein LOC142322739 [Lycorma delicatula]|uniref:uncharacterized protein LOC142322739 n=1 Tax=Lycorma delicatula TaxID=130591 RepID=UPI003F50EC24